MDAKQAKEYFDGKKTGTTGMQFKFLLTMSRADGSGGRVQEAKVIAIDTADAWKKMGAEVARYMRAGGMKVTDVQLDQ